MDRFHRKAIGALLFYDITDKVSFSHAKTWLEELRKTAGTQVTVTLVGNKSDQRHKREVEKNTAKTFMGEFTLIEHELSIARSLKASV